MQRCLHCNSVLTNSEKVCPSCGVDTRDRKWSAGEVMAWAGRLIFFSAAFTLLFTWLFPDRFPFEAVFAICAAALAFFVRR